MDTDCFILSVPHSLAASGTGDRDHFCKECWALQEYPDTTAVHPSQIVTFANWALGTQPRRKEKRGPVSVNVSGHLLPGSSIRTRGLSLKLTHEHEARHSFGHCNLEEVWDSSQKASKKPGISISLKFLKHLSSAWNPELQSNTTDFYGTNGNTNWQVRSTIPTWGSSHLLPACPFQLPHSFAWAVEQSQLRSHQLYEI